MTRIFILGVICIALLFACKQEREVITDPTSISNNDKKQQREGGTPTTIEAILSANYCGAPYIKAPAEYIPAMAGAAEYDSVYIKVEEGVVTGEIYCFGNSTAYEDFRQTACDRVYSEKIENNNCIKISCTGSGDGCRIIGTNTIIRCIKTSDRPD